MEICHGIVAEIDSEASARRGTFQTIVKSDTRGVLHEEMTSGLADEGCQEAVGEGEWLHHVCRD